MTTSLQRSLIRRMARTAALLGLAGRCLLTTQPAPAASADDEAALWRLWNQHLENPGAHQTRIDELRALERDRPDTPLVAVTQTLAAWHLLKLGREEEARELLIPYTDSGRAPLERAAEEMARAWLTRLDREQIVNALSQYRARHVRFPDDLDQLVAFPGLPEGTELPMEDRWGRSWSYRLRRFETMPTLTGQRYSLESRSLNEVHDLTEALAVPYAARISYEPARVLSAPNRPPAVQLIDPDDVREPITLSLGTRSDGIRLAYASDNLIILLDHLHWKVSRTP